MIHKMKKGIIPITVEYCPKCGSECEVKKDGDFIGHRVVECWYIKCDKCGTLTTIKDTYNQV